MLLPRHAVPALGLSALVFAAALLASAPASACSCVFPSVEAAREDASAIFEGRVVAIRELTPDAGPTDGQQRVTFSVVRSWKGVDRDERIDIVTNSSGSMCGYTFAVDTSYLVYTEGEPGALRVSSCSRTRAIAEASEDLNILGAGATPVGPMPKSVDGGVPVADAGVTSAVKPARSGGCASTRAQASVSGWMLAVPAVILGGRRRRRRQA